MAFIVADRVQETATANTTVSFTLSGAIASYQSFSAIGNGNTTYYGATDGTNWEVGLGTYSTSPNTLTRTTILSSSNSGAAVTFSGAVTVWCDYPAGKQISSDYPNALGVVTPAAGTFTTITGQTEILKGTGQNLLTNTVSLATTWTQTNITVTGSQTDPFGGSSAFLINDGTNTGQHTFFQSTSYASNTYTLSLYAKAGTANFVGLYSSGTNAGVIFNLSTGAVSANIGVAPTSSAITAVGSGWYRCSIVIIGTQTFSQFFVSEDGTNISFTGTSKTITVYAPQLEIGSTLNTYVPTTSAIVYGTPTLSFSGVAGLGLQSDGSLYVSPAGTGALQAQATTSSTVGGNARGSNAVDWQTSRGANYQVASGTYGVIVGGTSNQNNSFGGFLGSGNGNYVNGAYSAMGGGQYNQVTGALGFVGAGYTNYATGYLNVVVGGANNTGTANAAVTTQSGTMNGTTAVTLSSSNASIKVGQLISGTNITSAPATYVAAISGTSLTLSQAASGSSTSTLSFYTPHGVVVGGGNNQATGSYSFIGGGGDAGTAANRNVASGDWSVVAGGFKNVASGFGSFVGGGRTNTASGGGAVVVGGGTYVSGDASNTASGASSFVGSGLSNQATANYAFVGAGIQNGANAQFSAIMGGTNGTARAIEGNHIFPACYAPISNSSGLSQTALLVLARETTNATATVLTSNASAASGTNQVILPNNSAYYFTGEIISGVTGGGNTKGWTISGVIKRGANAGATTLVGSTVTSLYADAGAATWTIGLTADTTNGGLAVTFTGQAATTIRTVCSLRTCEMTF